MGSSHQNVKQILLKLEKKHFVSTVPDEKDKRKQRIFDGIDEKSLQTTIQTIMKMERNLSEL